MTTRAVIEWLTLAAALNSGLMAGVFMAFSTAVMKALGNLPPSHGIAAMQSINQAIINPWFLTPFFGTGAMCLVLVVAGLARWDAPVTPYWLAGSALYLAGAVLVTVFANVPRNQALDAVDANSVEAAQFWVNYLATWTAWNHVRTAAALAAAVCFTIAYRRS